MFVIGPRPMGTPRRKTVSHTNTFDRTAYNEVCNGGIVYDHNHKARAAVYGHEIVMAKGNVQHRFHAGTPVEKLAKAWRNLIQG